MTSENGGQPQQENHGSNDFIARAAREYEQGRPRAATHAESILQDVMGVIQQRRSSYGPPKEHFARTIGMINALFAHKLREPFTPEDWPQIMICDKLARHQEKPIADNPVDCAGYSACWGEVSQK